MKKSYVVFLCFFVTTLVAYVIYAKIVVNIPSKNAAEQLLKRDIDHILTVTEFLVNLEQPTAYINSADGSMYIGYTVNIDDEEVALAIKHLIESSGYHIIEKNNNTIYFLRWTRLMDFGGGITYSIDGQNKPELPHLTKLEPLSEENWYYYEEDYTKDRLFDKCEILLPYF